MTTSTESIGISEQVFLFVNASGTEVTCLDVAKAMNVQSGTNLILQTLSKKGLINERIEMNGTRKYSAKPTTTTIIRGNVKYHLSEDNATEGQEYVWLGNDMDKFEVRYSNTNTADSMGGCRLKVENRTPVIGEGLFIEDAFEGQRVVVKGTNGGYHNSGIINEIQNLYCCQVLLDDLRTFNTSFSELVPPTMTAPTNI